MEYELFRSKLKRSIDGALIPGMIRGSSSGLNSHRTAAMGLVIEGSIQECHERVFGKAKKNLRPDPTPQPKRTSEARNISVPEVRPPAPPPALRPPSESLPNGTTETVTGHKSVSFMHNAWGGSRAFSKSAKDIGVEQREEPPAGVKTNPSPSEVPVELECVNCHLRRSLSGLRSGDYFARCCCTRMKCVGCGTISVRGADACTGCHRKFK